MIRTAYTSSLTTTIVMDAVGCLPLQFVKIPDINIVIFLRIRWLQIFSLPVFTKPYANSRSFCGFWHIYCYLGGRVSRKCRVEGFGSWPKNIGGCIMNGQTGKEILVAIDRSDYAFKAFEDLRTNFWIYAEYLSHFHNR